MQNREILRVRANGRTFCMCTQMVEHFACARIHVSILHSFFDLAWSWLSSLCLCFRTISASIHSAVRQTYYHQMIMSWSTDDIDLSTESWPSVVYMKSSWSHPAAESSWYFCYLAPIAKPILIFSIQSQKAKLDTVKSADSKLLKSAVRFCEFKIPICPRNLRRPVPSTFRWKKLLHSVKSSLKS